MTSQTLPLIDIEKVCYTPAGTPVLRDVSLRSDASRIGIVGRNGSGKTSFARVLSGLVAADEGQVRIGGIDGGGLQPAIGAQPRHQIAAGGVGVVVVDGAQPTGPVVQSQRVGLVLGREERPVEKGTVRHQSPSNTGFRLATKAS